MGFVIGVPIQKGGSGKSTTVYEMAHIMAEEYGRRVLAVDFDPQASLSRFCGVGPGPEALAMLTRRPWEAVRPQGHSFDLVPADQELAVAELTLPGQNPRWGDLLAKGLRQAKQQYDYIFLDPPPSLGLLTTNVVLASDALIIPTQTEEEGVQGLGLLQRTISESMTDDPPPIVAVIPTRYDGRNNYHRDVLAGLKQAFGDLVTKPVKQTIRYPESTTMHLPIWRIEPELAAPWREVAQRLERWAGYAN